MDRKKRRKEAAPPAIDGGVGFDGMSSKQMAKLWEDIIDRDVVAARKIFFRALLRNAAAEHKQEAAAARRAAGEEEEDQDRGHEHERFFFWQSYTPREASPPPPEPMVVLCLRAAPPLQPTWHLAVSGLKREAVSRDATAEHKQEEVARRAAAAGVDGGGEDQGHPPPHERFFSEPSTTPRWEASPPSEPTHNAPTVVLCLPACPRRRPFAGLELDNDDDDEDQGRPPHERLILEPCSTPRDEASPVPTPIAPMVVLCLRAAPPHLTAGGPQRAAPSASITAPQCNN